MLRSSAYLYCTRDTERRQPAVEITQFGKSPPTQLHWQIRFVIQLPRPLPPPTNTRLRYSPTGKSVGFSGIENSSRRSDTCRWCVAYHFMHVHHVMEALTTILEERYTRSSATYRHQLALQHDVPPSQKHPEMSCQVGCSPMLTGADLIPTRNLPSYKRILSADQSSLTGDPCCGAEISYYAAKVCMLCI